MSSTKVRFMMLLTFLPLFYALLCRQLNVTEESAWGDEEPTYYNESAEIDNLRQQEREGVGQLPPPIPPLPDHYSARPSNLPVAAEGFQTADPLPASPLYENTANKAQDGAYSLAGEMTDINSPRHEPWFHGKLSRHSVSLVELSCRYCDICEMIDLFKSYDSLIKYFGNDT